MPNYKMEIAYDGTKYNGWQKQGNTRNTIQGLLEFVLEKLLGEPIQLDGAGRTDRGVHAKGQVANFRTKKHLKENEFLITLNQSLPKDIAIHSFEEVEERFHSRHHATRKTYVYQIWNSSISNVFQGHYFFQSSTPLDLQKMKTAGALFCGVHDFKGFCSNKRYKKSTLRQIYSIDIKKEGDAITMTFCGNGFLYHMVRIMAGTILQAGEGKILPADILRVLEEGDREAAGVTLPPQGLILCKVDF